MPLYFISTTLYFWVPVAVLGWRVLPRRTPLERKAFWLTLALFYPIMVGLEFFYLSFDIWSFPGTRDPYLGLFIRGVPIEEFYFWFGAIPFTALVYWALRDAMARRTEDA